MTGASGQIGSALLARLRREHRVVGFDLRPTGTVRRLDVASVRASAELRGFEAICHLAARISVEESVRDPPLVARTNILGTLRVLEAARRGDARVVFFSSAAVYGQPQRVPIDEDHRLRALSPYGLTKSVGEGYVRLYRELYGLHAAVVRPFNVYSEQFASDNPYASVIRRFLDNAVRHKPLLVQGDGGQTRDFVHVSDVVGFVALLLDGRGDGGTFNVGTGVAVRIGELAEWVLARFEPTGRVDHAPARPGDIRHSVANIDRAVRIGYRPRVQLRAWLARVRPPGAGTGPTGAARRAGGRRPTPRR